MNNLNNIADPVVEKLEKQIRRHIQESLEGQAIEDKKIMKLVPYGPTIPDNNEHIDIYIRSFAGQLMDKLKWAPAAAVEAVNKLKALGVNLPDNPDQAGIVKVLRSMSLEQLREADVFGQPHTQKDVDLMMQYLVDKKYEAILQSMDNDN